MLIGNASKRLQFLSASFQRIKGEQQRTRCLLTFLLLSLLFRTAYGQKPGFEVLYNLKGALPNPLVQDAAGDLFGSSLAGANVFKIVPATHSETVLFTFAETADGYDPQGSLTRDPNGNLYGTTVYGGLYLGGVIFRIDPANSETVLYNFGNSDADGWAPTGNLARDAEGNLYGVCPQGGAGFGVVYKLSITGEYSVLHVFAGFPIDGDRAAQGLFRDAAGNLYGSTLYGGQMDSGMIFKLSPDGTETILHNFSGTDGDGPSSPLIEDGAGNLYGTTFSGGKSGFGVLFRIDAAGRFSVVHNFPGGAAGGGPQGNLYFDARSGDIYGAADTGGYTTHLGACGDTGCGLLYKVDQASTQTVLYRFRGQADGYGPTGVIGRITGYGNGLDLYGTNLGSVVYRFGTLLHLPTN